MLLKMVMFIQVGQTFAQRPTEDPYYRQTRSMLSNLGLQRYEKNFKRGLLCDKTLPLLRDRSGCGWFLRESSLCCPSFCVFSLPCSQGSISAYVVSTYVQLCVLCTVLLRK